MPYDVVIHDNFHYMDPSERYGSGRFATAQDAATHCRQIVDEYLLSALKPGMSADDLWSNYTMFGEDPFIVGVDAPSVRFSAWDYARERCDVLCATSAAGDSPTSGSGQTASGE
jgi:hypothetical protein